MTLDEVLESLIGECHQDHVGLWEIVKAVQLDLGSKDSTEIWALTFQLVRRLLDERGMQVGHPAPDGRHFVSWNLPPAEAIHRIEQVWSALGREPDIGEVAWFTSAPTPYAEDDARQDGRTEKGVGSRIQMRRGSMWEEAKNRFPVGTRVRAIVTQHMPFGIFVDLGDPETTGLVLIHEFLDEGRMTSEQYPPIGASIKGVVLGHTDDRRKQIWLSMKPSKLGNNADERN